MKDVIQTPDEILRSVNHPRLEPLGQIELGSNDWLVVCGGFEDRSVAVLERAVSQKTSCNVLLINYEPYIAQNKSDAIRVLCQAGNMHISELTYNRQEPAGFGSIIAKTLRDLGERIIIDISGMSRLLIVQTLVGLRKHPQRLDKCYVAYAEARSYPPDKDEAALKLAMGGGSPSFSVFFLSSGVYEVTLVPELSSCAPAGIQTRLIAFPSLDAHQLIALRAELQPSRLSLIEGVPPGDHNHWRRQIVAEVNRLDDLSNNEKYQVSTLNYEEALACLLRIYEVHGLYERLLISPTGSKMQAVAVGILRSFLDDVQIVYPTPQDFLKPEKYTEGVGQIHLLSLDAFSAR